VPGGRTAPEATAATAVTAVSPASSAAALEAALEAALAAATMAAPSEASTTPVAAATPATQATELLPWCHSSDLVIFFLFLYKKIRSFYCSKTRKKMCKQFFFWCRGVRV
jgi:hypothetical protein